MNTQAARPGEIIVVPKGGVLTACEALNWVAFQRAEDADLTEYAKYWDDFREHPKRPPAFNILEYAAAEAADQLEPHHHAIMSDFVARLGKEPRELPAARTSRPDGLNGIADG